VLADTGHAVAARTVAALDPHLVVVGLSRYLRVFDPGTFEPVAQSDDEPIERHDLMNSETGRNVLECEVGGYLVRARRTDAWDAIVTLLVALEVEHNDCFHDVMRGCRRLSHSRAEVDGLDDLLAAPAQHLHDESIERERRRSRRGHTTPAEARAFLQMARQPQPLANPIATAFFRAADDDADSSPDATSAGVSDSQPTSDAPAAAAGHGGHVSMSIDAVIELLADADLMPEPPRALGGAADEDPRAETLPLLRRLMDFVRHHDETAYLKRTRELAFLANTLLAGCTVQSRPFTAREASDAAAHACNLGLEYWPTRWPSAASSGESSPSARDSAVPPEAFLVDHDLVTAFEVGWSGLYQDVSLFVADRLISVLADLDGVDPDLRSELRALERRLAKARQAGTPWLARDAADVLATLDTTAWVGVLGLLDECPILPAALTAVLERRTTSVSPTAFDFIATRAQIGDVRLFTRALPTLLSR
jgi:hypothetical protein